MARNKSGSDAGAGAGRSLPKGHSSVAPADPIALLNALGRRRRAAIKMQNKLTNATLAYLRSVLGWSPDLPEAERKKINARAQKAYTLAAKGEPSELDTSDTIVVQLNVASLAPWNSLRKETEKTMEKLATQLPGSEFVKSVRGFGNKTAAILVAEAGDLASYPKKGHLWKRLGLAPKTEYYDAELDAHLVPRRRRAECWACLGDSLIKAQIGGATDDAPAFAKGPYGAMYLRKKAEYLERGWTLIHAHKAAHRYMEKQAIRDWWQAWRREARRSLPEGAIGCVPPAAIYQDAAE